MTDADAVVIAMCLAAELAEFIAGQTHFFQKQPHAQLHDARETILSGIYPERRDQALCLFNLDPYVRKGEMTNKRSEMTNVKKTMQSKVSQRVDPDPLSQMDHEDTEKADEFLRNLFGTDDPIFAHGLWQQLKKLSFVNGKLCEGTFKFLVSFVAGVRPRDPLEAVLATEMAAIHKMMFDQYPKLAPPLADHAGISSMIMKFTRTFTMQMDALKRFRSKPEQQVVQHVMVAQGGQAIVGPVHQQQRKDAGATPPALTHSSERPMQPLADVPKEVAMRTRK
jgi:hypothetical protein